MLISERALQQPIAIGHISEIYAWEGNTILKLFRPCFPQDWADYEVDIMRIIARAGMRVPKVEGIIDIDGRRGIVYERIYGPTMADAINQNPLHAVFYARTLAKLHFALHCLPGQELPSFRQQIIRSIEEAKIIPEPQRQRALQKAEQLPDGDQLCHGDFHLSNIILAQDGPVVIDWFCAGKGHPAADLTRTYIILACCGAPPPGMPRWLVWLGHLLISRTYLAYYRSQAPEIVKQMAFFLPIVAAAKLNDNIQPEQREILKLIKTL